MRRFAAGEVSEILGDTFLKHDREQRILGLRVAARKALEVASAQNRSHFEAYARGVNAYIESHRDRLPIEFRILRYSPRQWAPEDSTLIASQMVKDLNHYPYRDALEREKIQAKLGPELTADLYVNSSWRDRPPTVTRPETRPGYRRGEPSPASDWRFRGGDVVRCGVSEPRQRIPIGFGAHGDRFKQLGGFRGAHGFGQAPALERYAPGTPDAQPLV